MSKTHEQKTNVMNKNFYLVTTLCEITFKGRTIGNEGSDNIQLNKALI